MFVFVYGTLKRNQSNHRYLQMAVPEFLGEAITTSPSYDLTSLGAFPAMIENGKYRVIGEAYDVEDISPLDHLEGHPHFYRRKIIPCTVGTIQYSCWTYFLPLPDGGINNSGIKTETDQRRLYALPPEFAFNCDWYLSQTKEWTGRDLAA